MTKDEFIDGYLKRSKIERYRTPNGYAFPNGRACVALPCGCGEHGCVGWAMVADDPLDVETHNRLYAP